MKKIRICMGILGVIGLCLSNTLFFVIIQSVYTLWFQALVCKIQLKKKKENYDLKMNLEIKNEVYEYLSRTSIMCEQKYDCI